MDAVCTGELPPICCSPVELSGSATQLLSVLRTSSRYGLRNVRVFFLDAELLPNLLATELKHFVGASDVAENRPSKVPLSSRATILNKGPSPFLSFSIRHFPPPAGTPQIPPLLKMQRFFVSMYSYSYRRASNATIHDTVRNLFVIELREDSSGKR